MLNHQVRKHASSIRTLVLLGVAVLAPLSALWLLRQAEVDRSNDAPLTWGASAAAHLDQSECSMGGGADCEVDATYTTPEARAVGSFRSPILRTTQSDSRNIVGRRTSLDGAHPQRDGAHLQSSLGPCLRRSLLPRSR